jgi:lysophospholipase L1-like esterase
MPSIHNNVLDYLGPHTLAGDGTTNDTAAIKHAHDAAFAAGLRTLYFPPGTYFAPDLLHVGNVIFEGPGKLAGTYRKRIIPAATPAAEPSRFDLTAAHRRRWDQAVAAARPENPAVLVLMGDSTTAGGADAIAPSENQLAMLQRRMFESHGAKAEHIRIFNRGISSMTWAGANRAGIGNQLPARYPWYSKRSRAWLDYVLAPELDGVTLAPDAILFNFGMNAAGAFDPTDLQAVVATVQAQAPLRFGLGPDLWFMTNYNPSLMAERFATEAAQEGRDFVAGYTRTYAQKHGYGLIDQHRLACMVKDGFDPRTTHFKIAAPTARRPLPYTFPTPCSDFSVQIMLVGSAAQLWDHGNLDIQLSPKPGNRLILECDTSTGQLAYRVDAAHGIFSRQRTVTSAPARLDNLTLQVDVRGGLLMLGAGVVDHGFFPPCSLLPAVAIERHGGLFRPVIAMTMGPANIPIVIRPRIGEFALTQPTITDHEQFGTAESGSFPHGGQGLHHMTSTGMQAIMARVLNATEF